MRPHIEIIKCKLFVCFTNNTLIKNKIKQQKFPTKKLLNHNIFCKIVIVYISFMLANKKLTNKSHLKQNSLSNSNKINKKLKTWNLN